MLARQGVEVGPSVKERPRFVHADTAHRPPRPCDPIVSSSSSGNGSTKPFPPHFYRNFLPGGPSFARSVALACERPPRGTSRRIRRACPCCRLPLCLGVWPSQALRTPRRGRRHPGRVPARRPSAWPDVGLGDGPSSAPWLSSSGSYSRMTLSCCPVRLGGAEASRPRRARRDERAFLWRGSSCLFSSPKASGLRKWGGCWGPKCAEGCS